MESARGRNGSAKAVFFHLRARLGDFHARLSDGNAELMNCHLAVRDRVEELMSGLDKQLQQYRSRGSEYYNLVRSQHHLPAPVERASRAALGDGRTPIQE